MRTTDSHLTALERAFQLAESGRCRSIEEIRRSLKAEGYSDEQVTGTTLRRQLNQIIQASRRDRRDPAETKGGRASPT